MNITSFHSSFLTEKKTQNDIILKSGQNPNKERKHCTLKTGPKPPWPSLLASREKISSYFQSLQSKKQVPWIISILSTISCTSFPTAFHLVLETRKIQSWKASWMHYISNTKFVCIVCIMIQTESRDQIQFGFYKH